MGSQPETTMRNAAGLLLLLQAITLCLSLPAPQNAEPFDTGSEFCIRTDQPYLSHAQRQFTQSMEKFTQSIYLHMAKNAQNSNFVFSPLSMHSALTMLYLGTTDNSTTQSELSTAMGGLVSKDSVQCSYKNIVDVYSQEENFKYGNKFWLQNGYDVNPKFSSNTVLYLANALYFKEEWLVPFEDLNYDDSPLTGNFETPTGAKEVGMIQQINSNATYGEIKIFQNEVVEVVSLPYKNDLFEMQIILPK